MKKKLVLAAFGPSLVVAAALVVSGCADRKRSPTNTDAGPQGSPATWANLPADTKVVGVDAVAKAPKVHAGRVAVEGVVAKVFAARGAFSLIDATEFAACGRTDCAEYTVPVLVPKDEFQGDLPAEKETVLAIGDVQPNGKGFAFVVQEVRRGDSTILSRSKPANKGHAPSAKAQLPDCLPETLLANKDALALTADQIAKLTMIQASFSAAHGRVQKTIAHCQGELIELLEKKPVDQAKVEHEKKEIVELKSELAKELRKAEEAARSVLTPEQTERVPEIKDDDPC